MMAQWTDGRLVTPWSTEKESCQQVRGMDTSAAARVGFAVVAGLRLIGLANRRVARGQAVSAPPVASQSSRAKGAL